MPQSTDLQLDRCTQTRVMDLLLHLPEPTPAALRAARKAAGHTQFQAAALSGYGSQARWSEIERGVRNIDLARWALYLLSIGQHPTAHASATDN